MSFQSNDQKGSPKMVFRRMRNGVPLDQVETIEDAMEQFEKENNREKEPLLPERIQGKRGVSGGPLGIFTTTFDAYLRPVKRVESKPIPIPMGTNPSGNQPVRKSQRVWGMRASKTYDSVDSVTDDSFNTHLGSSYYRDPIQPQQPERDLEAQRELLDDGLAVEIGENEELINQRHMGITEIVRDIETIHEIMSDIRVMTDHQGDQIGLIEDSIFTAEVNAEAGTEELKKASKHQKKYRNRLCCLGVGGCGCLAAILVTLGLTNKLGK